LGLPLPLSAVQILWINLVSDGFPNLSLTIDPKREDIMSERPRSPNEHIVTGWMLKLIGFVSFVAGLIAFLSFYFINKNTGNIVLARSVTFVTIGINSLIYVFSVRAPTRSFLHSHLLENKWLIISVLGGFGLQALPFITQSTRDFFRIELVGINYWLLALGLSIAMFFIVEIFKHFYRPPQKSNA
jgi:Ca2+-transporting ATPase